MIVKTITCHDVYNVGAGLQAYALNTWLCAQGYDAEIIDYKPQYLRHYSLTSVPNPKYRKPGVRELYILAKLPRRIKALSSSKKKAFDDFKKKYLKVTDKEYQSNDALKAAKQDADVYIAGSDQIWNPLFPNGKDPSFYLDFVRDARKVSYAASFAVNALPEDLVPKVQSWLASFDAISVREKSGLDILNGMGYQGMVVCDPVFLLSEADWKRLAGKRPDREPYLFVYDFDKSDKIASLAKQIAEKRGLKIVSYFSNDYADVWEESGPIEFLQNILGAEMVISNSFHATAFSLLFQKEFFTTGRAEAINTRMSDLLQDMDLKDRYLIGSVEDWEMANPIDWEQTKEHLKTTVEQSERFLRNALSD